MPPASSSAAVPPVSPAAPRPSSERKASDGLRTKPAIFFTNVHERNVASAKLLLDVSFPFPYQPQWFANLLRQDPDFRKLAHFNDVLVGVVGCMPLDAATAAATVQGGAPVDAPLALSPEAAAAAAAAATATAAVAVAALAKPVVATTPALAAGETAPATAEAAAAPEAAAAAASVSAAALPSLALVPVGAAPRKLYVMALAVLAAYRNYGVGAALMREVLDAVARQPDIDEVFLHVWTANGSAIRFYERLGFTRGEVVKGYYRRIEPPDAVVLRLAVNRGAAAAVAAAVPAVSVGQ